MKNYDEKDTKNQDDSTKNEQSPTKKELSPSKEYKKLYDARSFKTANDLYYQARENEKFDTGIQWDGINSKNLDQATYNIVHQIKSIKNASILANKLSMQRRVDRVDEGDERIEAAIEGFNLADAKNWERLDMDTLLEESVDDGSIQGLAVSYWWWNEDIETGNKFLVSGDIDGKTVDQIDLYVGNPHEVDIQKQPWVKITTSMTVGQLREYAMNRGVPREEAEQIMPDEQERAYRAWEKTDYDSNQPKDDQVAELIFSFERRQEDGEWKVYKAESTKDIVIEDWKDIDMSIYPIAVMPYKKRKGFIYGEAEMTRYLENQKILNMQESIRHKHAKLMAIPKVLINENMIGSFSNAVGSINKVKVPPQTQIGNAMQFVQPSAMSMDVDKSIQSSAERTQQYAGVGQTLQATARPENAAALLTQIKQAAVPLESYKRRLYRYVEDIGRIWEEFYKNYYSLARVYVDEDGNEVEFTGTDFKDINMKVATDVGPSTQWSEITSWQMLMDLWNAQIITDPSMLIDRLPENSIANQEGLRAEIQDKETLQMLTAFIFQGMQQGDEMAQMFNDASVEEKAEMLRAMMPGEEVMQ